MDWKTTSPKNLPSFLKKIIISNIILSTCFQLFSQFSSCHIINLVSYAEKKKEEQDPFKLKRFLQQSKSQLKILLSYSVPVL